MTPPDDQDPSVERVVARLDDHRRRRGAAKRRPLANATGKPTEGAIALIGGTLPAQIDALDQALAAQPALGVYQRGGLLVEIVEIDAPQTVSGVQRARGTLAIVPVSTPRARDLATRAVPFERYDARRSAWARVDCPRDVAEAWRARGTWTVPTLRGVCLAPTLRADGSLVDAHGYDAASGLFVDLRGEAWPTIPACPSPAQAIEAREQLEDLIGEFPFVDAAARATWLAALLTAVIRPSLRSAPFFGFDAPAMASGKTLLAELVGIIATGAAPAAIGQPKDEAEAEKMLVAALLAGDPVLLIDNVERPLEGEMFCRIATSETCRARMLGFSEMRTVPTHALVLATGNNLRARGDLSTRLLLARLDAGVERPEARSFRRPDIRRHARQHRAALVSAALTVLRGYLAADRPAVALAPFGRFEQWSGLVRAALVWTGAADPCATRARVEASDTVREQHGALLSAWWPVHKDARLTAKELAASVSPGPEGLGKLTPVERELREALMFLAGERDAINVKRLGKLLADFDGRIRDGRRIERAGQRHGVALWCVRESRPEGLEGLKGSSLPNAGECQDTDSYTDGPETDPLNPPNPPPTDDATLDAALRAACAGLAVAPDALRAKLGPTDLADFAAGELTVEDLRAVAETLARARDPAETKARP